MPVSSFAIIPDIINEAIHKRPKRVLDCGIGHGMYGAILKNYLQKIELIGIEGWEKYEHPNWANYDEILIGKMPDVFQHVAGSFDLIIMADVIEHFSKEEGRVVVGYLKSKLKKEGVLLISTPAVFIDQDAVGGNKLEIHKSLWEAEDLPEFTTLRDSGPDKYGHYMQVFKFIWIK